VIVAERIRKYEIVMALSPMANETESDAIISNLEDFIASNGGEVSEKESWGLKRLSYPVKNYREGNYVRTLISMSSSSVSQLENNLNANEDVLIHMVTKV
tara:strand:+ start:2130 stop:2429 length:300 start_codon:yes stop_codon:yes gene_type:complete